MTCGAVIVVEHCGVFKKLIGGDLSFKFFAGNEVVFNPILFTATWSARGVGDGKFEVGNDAAYAVDQRRFAGAGGSG
jgi:hypothetical protein